MKYEDFEAVDGTGGESITREANKSMISGAWSGLDLDNLVRKALKYCQVWT